MTKRNNTIKKSDPIDETATSATLSATTAVTACCPEEEKLRTLASDYLNSNSNNNNNKKACCAQPNYKTKTGTCQCDEATMNRVKNDALRKHARQARHDAANCATIGTTIVVLVVLLLNASTLVSLFSLFFPAEVQGFVPNPYQHHQHRTFGNNIDLLEHRMTSKMDSFKTTNGGSGEGDDPGVMRKKTTTTTTESSPPIIQVQEKVKQQWPPNEHKTEQADTIDPMDAVFRGKSTMNKKEGQVVTFTDRLTMLLDTPFFDPDAYEDDDPTVLGKFATIIKQDYELFEAAFVACFFVVLIFIAQDLLRIQMMNSLAGGGSGSHLFWETENENEKTVWDRGSKNSRIHTGHTSYNIVTIILFFPLLLIRY